VDQRRRPGRAAVRGIGTDNPDKIVAGALAAAALAIAADLLLRGAERAART